MFDAISGARPSAQVRSGHGVPLAGVFLASLICFAILLIIKAPNPRTADVQQLQIHADDAMRLTQVQDFLNGLPYQTVDLALRYLLFEIDIEDLHVGP